MNVMLSRPRVWLLALATATAACTSPRGEAPKTVPAEAKPTSASAQASDTTDPGLAASAEAGAFAAPLVAQKDADGNDDLGREPPSSAPLFEQATFTKVGRAPLGLLRICDLKAFGGKLYSAHANMPLGTDGATITTYRPDEAKAPFAVAFDWNRAGEPTKGGGGGQGFLRVHAIDGRLYVPDADPPYGGLGAVDHGTEGYVFVSDKSGTFARARYPHAMLPGLPNAEDRPGASVLPRAYHVLDVVKFRGHVYASTGSVPPEARAWQGPSPGALHVANGDLSRFTYALGFPTPYPGGVWRLTYMTRFKDMLFAGIQDYDGKSPWDYARFTLPAETGRDVLRESDATGKRVTDLGAAFTLRWYTDRGALYWIAGTHDGTITLRRTTDGDTWDTIDLPPTLGRPTDIVRFRGSLVVMMERGLAAIDEGGKTRALATITEKKTPFAIDDILCAAPLGVLDDKLYVGAQNGSGLYRIDPKTD